MNQDKKKKNASKNNKENGKFNSKNIKHNPSSESSRAIFGLNDTTKDKD